MSLITLHPTEDGVQRLMTMMFDVGCYPDPAPADLSSSEAKPSHLSLFEGYRKMLRQAYKEAAPWWDETVRSVSPTREITPEAIALAFDKRAAGAASDPRVVWIVRMVWHECIKRNENLSEADRLRPETLLLQWLIDAGEEDLVRLLACMPYWPIGLDENGNWC